MLVACTIHSFVCIFKV